MKARLIKHEGERVLVTEEQPKADEQYYYENWTKYRIIARGPQIALSMQGQARKAMPEEELDAMTGKEVDLQMDRHWEDGEYYEVLFVNNKVTINGTSKTAKSRSGTSKSRNKRA